MNRAVKPVEAVEAGSLSILAAIASQPPQDPTVSFKDHRDPLTLYLARVPGSRDVFLTLLKPRDKTVSAYDVENCLYYVHFEEPSSEQPIQYGPPSQAGDLHPQGRPLPPTPDQQASGDTNSMRIPSVRRKPVANPVNAENRSPALAFHKSMYPIADGAPNPPLPLRPSNGSSVALHSPSVRTATLIRRDPSSGTQSNVARIMDPPVDDISSEAAVSLKGDTSTGSPLYLEITNPGYQKFDRGVSARFAQAQISDNGSTHTIPSLSSSVTTEDPSSGDEGDGVFQRRMWMEGSHFSSSSSWRRSLAERRTSEAFINTSSSLDDGAEYPGQHPEEGSLPVPHDGRLQASGPKRSNNRNYTFLSPWHGRCEFAAATVGTSLKCRHSLPDGSEPITISELRFNLPFQSSHRKSLSQSSTVGTSFLSPGARHTRNAHSASSVASDMDLSLGQELAGGGATGKQAKLGKLIIEPEGLKMLDLLVACNIGLWWRAYSRTFV